jgi:hypothetical protein
MQSRLRGAIVIAALIVPGVARAQPVDAEPEPKQPPKADTAGAPAEPPPTPPPPSSKPPVEGPGVGIDDPVAPPPAFEWQAFGYLRMQYIAVQNDPNVAFVGRDDGFELQNARIGFHGTLHKRAAFTIALDGAVDERAQLNAPEGKLKVGLRDAYGDIALGGDFAVRGGYFATWVDPEVQIGDTARELVDRPIESRGMRATEGWQTPGLTPGRSLGVALRLDPKPPDHGTTLGLEVAVQNGADEFASNNDNDLPSVSASALVRFPNNGWLVASGRWNARTVGDLPFRQDETDLQATLGAHLVFGAVSLGGAVATTHTIYQSTGGPSQDAYGAHGQAMVTIPTDLPLAVGYRFGVIDPSSLIVTDQVMEHTAAAVLVVPSLRMRVQLQLTHVVEQASRDLSNDRVQVAAELSL